MRAGFAQRLFGALPGVVPVAVIQVDIAGRAFAGSRGRGAIPLGIQRGRVGGGRIRSRVAGDDVEIPIGVNVCQGDRRRIRATDLDAGIEGALAVVGKDEKTPARRSDDRVKVAVAVEIAQRQIVDGQCLTERRNGGETGLTVVQIGAARLIRAAGDHIEIAIPVHITEEDGYRSVCGRAERDGGQATRRYRRSRKSRCVCGNCRR